MAKREKWTKKTALNQEWTDYYMFLLPSGSSKSLCLIWSRTLAFRESDNGKRCYETKHKSFEKTYLHKSEPRALTSSSMQKKQKKLTIVLKYHTDMMYFIQF